MSKRVGIVGAGVTPFKGTWREKTYYELAQMATREAVKDAQVPIQDVDAAFYGIYNDIFERTAITDSVINKKLWISKNMEFNTIFKLDRMARSVARSKKA